MNIEMNIEMIVEIIGGILFIMSFIALIILAERDIKKHPELVGKREPDEFSHL